jgi:hypothetical protein
MRTAVLCLLDKLLSQDTAGVSAALTQMRDDLLRATTTTATTVSRTTSTASSTATAPLLQLVSPAPLHAPPAVQLHAYLQQFPLQASVASVNDGSLPLHFAASLGSVEIARVVWQMVRVTVTFD